MKHIKSYEINLAENSEEIKMQNLITNYLVDNFFANCGNFASEDSWYEGDILQMFFYFPAIEEDELEIILECRNYISDYLYAFFLQPNTQFEDIKLTIKTNKVKELYEKILMEVEAGKYNL